MADKRGLFRINYYESGQPRTSFVVALTDVEAAQFLGVASASGVQVTRERYPVEVSGLDEAHATVASLPVTMAPFDLSKSVSRDEFNALQAQLAELNARLLGQGVPVSPGPTRVQPDPPAKE